MVLVVVATVLGALAPTVARQLTHARINRAATVIAGDFFLAQGLAARQRSPVILQVSASAKTVTISDSRTATVYTTRHYGPDSDFKIQQFSASPTSLVVLPNGMANTTVTVTLSDGTYQRQVKMSRAGQIRIL